jgi:hypothetical protein
MFNKIFINDKQLSDSIDHHGANKKKTICIQEMAELTQEVTKDMIGCTRREKLVKEFTDTLICMEMMRLMYDIQDEEIQRWIDFKQARQLQRDRDDIYKFTLK